MHNKIKILKIIREALEKVSLEKERVEVENNNKDFDSWSIEKKGLEHDGKIFTVILSQLRLTSVKRFRRFIRKISPHQFGLIKDKLVSFLKEDSLPNERNPLVGVSRLD
jgi:hypothetical protein